ncbi:hypothetical protein RND71_010933 [Anisodus tanguticus]|uniref:Diphthine--ammonia ligase n=1 Tax=Anisodus tanguticus TaxID=243964 RepID=A0AAE1SI09_9SOLA|nr:hypothetical protein RND71_010933 [Anisodus tanguticus]
MKVVALVSGGKDNCYIVALANLIPADDATDELDSYMYQTVGHQIVVSYAKCMGLPLFQRRIQGSTRQAFLQDFFYAANCLIGFHRHHDLSYSMTPGDEVEDMFILLNEVKRQIPSVTAVSSGAIASDYQRLRVESICSRLGLVSLAYLWKQDQSFLLQEMIRNGIIAILVKVGISEVAAIGLNPSKHLGKEMVYMESHLHKLKELYGINACGEGGEYETLTLDCPLFKANSIAPVGILHPLAFHLENKAESISSNGIDEGSNVCLGNMDTVFEVQGDVQQEGEAASEFVAVSSKRPGVTKQELKVSKTMKDNVFSISCWLQDSCKSSSDLQEDLEVVLMKIEALLVENGSSWENVLYIHLYIADMDEFAVANETYVRYITQGKCRYGVPSWSTIELPLLLVGLGRTYIEVLVANDPTKKVLHVQSISCWAPSCIGPYSQATLHNDILHMAGQLGLDPTTMVLCEGDPVAELEQALENSEAKSVVYGKICTAILSVSEELAAKFCSLTNDACPGNPKSKGLIEEEQVIMIARFCIYRLNKVLLENNFSWDDVMNFRLYFASSGNIPHGTLSRIFSDVFNESAQMSRRIKVDAEPILNIVPVLGAGKYLSTLDDIFTCELIATKC